MTRYLLIILLSCSLCLAGFDAGSGKIINVNTPTDDNDAANKYYVDNIVSEGNGLVNSVNGYDGIVILDANDIGITDTNISNWQTAYADRLKWDGGSSGLVAATGRTSLGLGTAALRDVGSDANDVIYRESNGYIYVGSDTSLQPTPTGGGIITQRVHLAGNPAAYHLRPYNSADEVNDLPQWGPRTEFVLYRTPELDNNNFQRISLTAMADYAGPGLNDDANDYRLQMEVSGTRPSIPYIITSQKDTGYVVFYQTYRADGNVQFFQRTDSPAGTGDTFELSLETEKRGLENVLTGAGTQDSPSFRLTGKGYDTSLHDCDWKMFVDMGSNAGNGNLLFQNRIDAAVYGTRATLTDSSIFTADTISYGNTTTGAGTGNSAVFVGKNTSVMSNALPVDTAILGVADKSAAKAAWQMKDEDGVLSWVAGYSSLTGNTLLYSTAGNLIASATVSAPLAFTTDTLSIPKAATDANGYLDKADWTTFNNKITTETDPCYLLLGVPYIGAASDVNLGSYDFITTGTLGAGAITGTSFVIGANTLTTTEWAYLDGQNQSVLTTSSPTFAGLGIATPAVANQALTILGGTAEGVKILQGADDKGLSVYGYDDQSTKYFKLFIDKFGQGGFQSNSNIVFTSGGSSYVYFLSGTHIYMNLGDAAGVRHFYLRNSSSAVKFDVDSYGNTLISGTLGVTGLTTATGGIATPKGAITLGVGATAIAITKSFHVITGDGGGNTIATITGGVDGQILRLLFVDALVAITDTDAHTANTVDLSAAFTSADDTVLTLISDGTSWYECSRSIN